MEVGQKMVAFVSGLLIASLYGLMTLFLQKQPLWFCAHTTLGLAGLAAFGMGLSVSVRASVMVMLPSMCSGLSATRLQGFIPILSLFIDINLTCCRREKHPKNDNIVCCNKSSSLVLLLVKKLINSVN